jgi:hypothetical protein
VSSLVTGGRTTPVRLAAGFVAGLAVALGVDQGLASDGDLQRALLDSGCVQATIRALRPLGQTLLYEANCFGSSHSSSRSPAPAAAASSIPRELRATGPMTTD